MSIAGCSGPLASFSPALAWYANAVICMVPCPGADHPSESSAALSAVLDSLPRLRSEGITCLRFPFPWFPGPDSVGTFLWVKDAAERHELRVMVDVADRQATYVGMWRGQLEGAEFWIRHGSDAVVLPRAALSDTSDWCDDEGESRYLISVDGTPVPLVDGAGTVAVQELGYFRAALDATIAESIRRASSIPLLGLLIRLGLRTVRRQHGRLSDVTAESNGASATATCFTLSGRDRAACRALTTRLLAALPGPLQVPFDSGQRSGRGSAPLLLADLSPLLRLRARSPAMLNGCVCPVGLGGGPALAFVRDLRSDVALVVANMSNEPAEVRCELTGYERRLVVDMLDGRLFPPVSDDVYVLRLAPFACHWLHVVRS